MKILRQSQIDEAAEILKKGGLIAFPTETVFGLGVVYDNKAAYDWLVQVKRRPPEKPFTLMLADPEDVEKYAELTNVSRALVKAFMPGQFTMITKAKEGIPSWCVSGEGNIGIRIADYPLIRELIRKTGKPLLVPSANRSGEEPANSAKEVEQIFKNEIEAVVEGFSTSKIPSTVVLVKDNYTHVFREGVVTIDKIKKVIEKESK
ncbi:MAG: threonylcarbamoyl-AMP synthase [Alphaproteobacteria bacterium]|nr:threonylcarbamoyl-AMP synthase [Alphaproteobacteria bacterium]